MTSPILRTRPTVPGLRGFALALLIAALALLAGCETPREALGPAEPAGNLEKAEKLAREGEFVLAAREFDRLAIPTRGAMRAQWQLRAVEMLLKANETREAGYRLEHIHVREHGATLIARKQILQSRLLLLQGAHERAIRQLNDAIALSPLPPTVTADILVARAEAEQALNNPFGAIRNLIQREQYLAGKDDVRDNQNRLWKILEDQKRNVLSAQLDITRDRTLAGWVELAMLAQEHLNRPDALRSALERWRQTYPKHPALAGVIATLLSRAPRLPTRFMRIALLLPLTSDVGSAAQAVRDGFLAAHNNSTDPDKPKIQIYDLGADPAKTPDIYQQAVKDGAQIVVGPLGRQSTDELVRKGNFPVPTVLLSHIDNTESPGSFVFQFGLPPEQEARQAAERAYLDGHRQAAVLYPKSPWGERMRLAFVEHWQKLGGTIRLAQTYDPADTDFSEPVKQLLNIVQGEERLELIKQAVGQRVHFEPRPRQDIDAVFLATDAARGRLIKPQLSFFRARRIPVYATSHIFSGRENALHDIDLDGVLFVDMPWMLIGEGNLKTLRASLQSNWPHAQTDLDRLFALGVDSYAILPHLARLSSDPSARFLGVTSGLSLDPQGRLKRQMLWAQFKRGVPTLIDSGAATRPVLRLEGSAEQR
ncbi:MAG: penicillin-binding protein activator [Pseudomonadota bacterium]